MRLRTTSSAIATGSMAASSRADCSMGIRDKPTAPASPWQNGFAERLIGSIRRECLVPHHCLGRERRILRSCANYYSGIRTHRSLNKDAPVCRPVQRTGVISHVPSWADFTTTTPVFKFSVHTGKTYLVGVILQENHRMVYRIS